MDILLLGVAALVLIALTLWIVWRPAPESTQPQESAESDDLYTSATADLSAGGVALAISTPVVPPEPAVAEPLTPPVPREEPRPRPVRIGAAAVLALGGAIGGAWLYSRWSKERNKPLNRLRRRLR